MVESTTTPDSIYSNNALTSSSFKKILETSVSSVSNCQNGNCSTPNILKFDLLNITASNLNEILDIMSAQTTGDLTGCLIKCFNNGQCQQNPITRMYGCLCNQYFFGSQCESDIRPCSKYPCLNNGVCSNVFTSNEIANFQCACKNSYFGVYCENQVDPCQNKTCANGYCINNGSVPYCKCLNNYYGNECELEMAAIKVVRGVRMSTLIICFLCISLLVSIIILNDICGIFIKKGKKTVKKSYSKSEFHA